MTTTEIAVRSSDSLEAKIRYAQALASASLLPSTYRDKPANVLLAVELGESLGISSIQAINGIHVIEGKPSASADLIASLVRRAGHKLRVTVDDVAGLAVAQIIRVDDPEFTYTATWNEAKARAAGLWGKGNWSKYPGQMLRNRAISEVARMGASDALYGVIYTPEELGAETDADGNVTPDQATSASAEPAGKPPRIQDAIASRQVLEVVPVPDPEPSGGVADPVELRTDAQARKLAVLIRENAMERDESLAYFGSIIGRDLNSTKELTKAEASKVIDALESAKDTGADPQTGEIVDAEVVDWPETAPIGGGK